MAERATRRQFLRLAGMGSAFGLANLEFLSKLPAVSAQEAALNPKLVRLDAGVEPLTRLIEDTPRAELLEKIAQRIRQGTTYQEVVASLFLAGIRNLAPRPSVGFKFHAVMVVNAAHLESLAAPESERWLPIFWALDEFKDSQAMEQKESGWRMAPVDESAVPPPHKAKQAFIEAMDNWDEKRADAAIAGLVRSAGANQIYELFYRFGARDFRDIGHKAIFVSHSWRMLQFIGWQHAEPVLRSLTSAVLTHDLKNTTPALADQPADRPWRRNIKLITDMKTDWMSGTLDEGASRDMLGVLRQGSNNDACDKAVELIGRGISPNSIWDALFVAAGEIVMRQPAVPNLHTMSSTNALRYAFQATGDEDTRKLLLLQNCAFIPMFREAFRGGKIADIRIDDLKPLPLNQPSAAMDEIFNDTAKDRMSAARKIRQYLNDGGDVHGLMNSIRRLIFTKGVNAHDYKFSCAMLEDYFKVSPAWRNQFLSTGIFYFKGTGDKDNPLVQRTREAMKV
jgi:hypothetical protein